MKRLDLDILDRIQVNPTQPAIGVDPLIPAARIALGIGVSRNTVLSHSNQWRAAGGILRGLAIFPNPGLVHSRLVGLLVATKSNLARNGLSQAVDLSSEILVSTDLADRTWILLVDEGYGASDRWIEYLERIDGLSLESPPVSIDLPSPQRPLSAFQWRLLNELRKSERPRSIELAKALGATPHTVARNYGAMFTEHAFFAYPLLDYRRFPGVVGHLMIRFDRSGELATLRAAIIDAGARLLPITPTVPGWFESAESYRGDRNRYIGFLFHVESAAAASDVARDVSERPGVREALLSFPAETRYFPRCFDRLIEGGLRERDARHVPHASRTPTPRAQRELLSVDRSRRGR